MALLRRLDAEMVVTRLWVRRGCKLRTWCSKRQVQSSVHQGKHDHNEYDVGEAKMEMLRDVSQQ